MGLYTNIAHASQNFASQMRKKFKLVFRADMCEAKTPLSLQTCEQRECAAEGCLTIALGGDWLNRAPQESD